MIKRNWNLVSICIFVLEWNLDEVFEMKYFVMFVEFKYIWGDIDVLNFLIVDV